MSWQLHCGEYIQSICLKVTILEIPWMSNDTQTQVEKCVTESSMIGKITISSMWAALDLEDW